LSHKIKRSTFKSAAHLSFCDYFIYHSNLKDNEQINMTLTEYFHSVYDQFVRCNSLPPTKYL